MNRDSLDKIIKKNKRRNQSIKVVASLFVVFTLVCLGLYSFTSKVSTELTQESAVNSAEIYIKALEKFRTLYTSEVVNTVKKSGIEVTHDYQGKAGTIPLPATLSMLLGKKIGEHDNGAETRLYSPFPFPWREKEGGLQDKFSQQAWQYLENNPTKNFLRFEEFNGEQVLRYAKADLMRESCVQCHNNHALTPKKGWKVGDVRGILEVILPLSNGVAYSDKSLTDFFWLLILLSIAGISSISFFVIKANKAAETLADGAEIKARIAEFSKLVGSEQQLNKLSHEILGYLSRAMQASHGVVLINDHKDSYSTIASYAWALSEENKTIYRLGEGLIGQTALDQSPLIIDNIPSDYVGICSGLGESQPQCLLFYPVIYDNKTIAVIELASLNQFREQQLYLIDEVQEIIAISLHTALSTSNTEVLLKINQRQVAELKVQQEELSSANQELEEQTLQLQQTAEELKTSEEELQFQSDELRASNEELEEKQESLQAQTTKLIESKKAMEQSALELAQASTYKSEFLANMSHELRTPLNSLLILSKLLSENKQKNLTEEQIEELNIIHEGGHSLLTLINDIMDLSKVEAGMLTVNMEAISPQSISQGLDTLFSPIANDKNLDFIISISPEVPEFIQTDKQRLEQVLKNFLANAFKFTKQGSVKLSIERFAVGEQGILPIFDNCSVIAFSVSDTGIGIPLDKQQAIFESFQQADGSTSREYGGTGLGLSISKELTHLLGGEIKLTSEVGKGSCFTMYLPQKVAEQSTTTAMHSAIKTGNFANHITNQDASERDGVSESENIIAEETERANLHLPANDWLADDRQKLNPADKSLLIIEDDKPFAKILLGLAHQLDFAALATNEGREGVLLAKEFLPNAILLDLGLPDIDGLQVLEQLKSHLKIRHIPVHVISANEKKLESLHLGALNFLRKPAEINDIGSIIELSEQQVNQDGKSVLVVEDDKNSQIAIKRLIETKEIHLSFAETATQACQLLEEKRYDCIILDLGLPDISGSELVQTIRNQANASTTPIIIYTGKELSAEEQKVLQQFSLSIVIKGAESPERLLDDVALFLHQVGDKYSFKQQAALKIIHDENEMLKERRVLVVDDDMRNVFAMTKVLEDAGLVVSQAENGQAALDAINSADNSFELILMDIMMPIMNGVEATTKIRKLPAYHSTPIIALTAKTMPGDRHKCIEAGASEYLTKPIDTDKLLSILRVWLYQRKAT